MYHHSASLHTVTGAVGLLMALVMLAQSALASTGSNAPNDGAHYIKIRPDLIVNLRDESGDRILMLTVSVRGEDDAALQAVEHHMPALRHSLLLLLSNKRAKELTDAKAAEATRREALAAVREILTQETGEPGVRELYFTDLIVE